MFLWLLEGACLGLIRCGHMKKRNVEIKARSSRARHDAIRDTLRCHGAYLDRAEHQIDTYLCCPRGRLKLRELDGDMSLIFYERANQKGPKQSDFSFYRSVHHPDLKAVLERAYGVFVVVDKEREIWRYEHVTIHLDEVKGLGAFVEIEVLDASGEVDLEHLQHRCDTYISLLGISSDDLLETSYSDLLSPRLDAT